MQQSYGGSIVLVGAVYLGVEGLGPMLYLNENTEVCHQEQFSLVLLSLFFNINMQSKRSR